MKKLLLTLLFIQIFAEDISSSHKHLFIYGGKTNSKLSYQNIDSKDFLNIATMFNSTVGLEFIFSGNIRIFCTGIIVSKNVKDHLIGSVLYILTDAKCITRTSVSGHSGFSKLVVYDIAESYNKYLKQLEKQEETQLTDDLISVKSVTISSHSVNYSTINKSSIFLNNHFKYNHPNFRYNKIALITVHSSHLPLHSKKYSYLSDKNWKSVEYNLLKNLFPQPQLSEYTQSVPASTPNGTFLVLFSTFTHHNNITQANIEYKVLTIKNDIFAFGPGLVTSDGHIDYTKITDFDIRVPEGGKISDLFHKSWYGAPLIYCPYTINPSILLYNELGLKVISYGSRTGSTNQDSNPQYENSINNIHDESYVASKNGGASLVPTSSSDVSLNKNCYVLGILTETRKRKYMYTTSNNKKISKNVATYVFNSVPLDETSFFTSSNDNLSDYAIDKKLNNDVQESVQVSEYSIQH